MTDQKDGSGASLTQNSQPFLFFQSGGLLITCVSKMGAAKANSAKPLTSPLFLGNFNRGVLEPAVLH